ncbi:MAG: Flp pilus assembly complex ATPase component TadA [Candidatus Kerfeldbacteria bacterium]|nr:Flp pilus assembly complex ATPase component TadA [Candidatus Kerfeldbacteria bacterium]
MLKADQLSKILREADLINVTDLTQALAYAEHEQRSLNDILVERDLISDEHLGQLIAEYSGYTFVNLRKTSITDETLQIIPETMAKTANVLVFGATTDAIQIAMSNPTDLATVHLLEKKTGKTAQVFYATERDLHDAMNLYRKGLAFEFADVIHSEVGHATSTAAANLSVIKILDTIIQYAYQQKSSDIHIEPTSDTVVVRFRIDGVLHDMVSLPKQLLDLLITRIKILARLRTDEHRAAQDGKLVQKLEEEDLDVRVSILPVAEGEKAVLRLLSSRSRQFALEDLGFSEDDIVIVRQYIKRPHGMILVTGPTGSGKTTTLYAILKILNRREVNISTIEDPIEYAIEGINQIQVNEATNLTFAKGLRSVVRQDPDIIMIGEIRDEETASIAVNSAMTGHLVLSTLHTNDAATTLPRLLDMNIEPFLVASTVNIAIGQRLVRRICSQCVMSVVLTGAELEALKKQIDLKRHLRKDPKELRLYQGKGCVACHHTGYKGRLGVFEVMQMSRTLRDLITNQSDADILRQAAIAAGMTTMFEDGLRKALLGETTLEEVMRVLVE